MIRIWVVWIRLVNSLLRSCINTPGTCTNIIHGQCCGHSLIVTLFATQLAFLMVENIKPISLWPTLLSWAIWKTVYKCEASMLLRLLIIISHFEQFERCIARNEAMKLQLSGKPAIANRNPVDCHSCWNAIDWIWSSDPADIYGDCQPNVFKPDLTVLEND